MKALERLLCWCGISKYLNQEMDPEHRQRINECSQQLREMINYQALLPKLRESCIFPDDMLLDIQTVGPNDGERLDLLLKYLPKRGPTAFEKFILCLIKSGHTNASNLLQGLTSGMDMWDGQVVQSAQVYNAERSQNTYAMTSRPRGVALILSYTEFVNETLPRRDGGELDVAALKDLFEKLDFLVDIHLNLTNADTKAVIQLFAIDPRHSNADAAIICCLSHGVAKGFYCSDFTIVTIDWLLEQFNNENCAKLHRKPKIFFLQHCRGDEIDHAIAVDGHWQSDSHVDAVSSFASTEQTQSLAAWSDMKICHSTSPNKLSFRSATFGSFFIRTLVSVIGNKAHYTHLDDMLKEVTSLMLKEEIRGMKQSTEIFDRGWQRNLYFNPGMYNET